MALAPVFLLKGRNRVAVVGDYTVMDNSQLLMKYLYLKLIYHHTFRVLYGRNIVKIEELQKLQ